MFKRIYNKWLSLEWFTKYIILLLSLFCFPLACFVLILIVKETMEMAKNWQVSIGGPEIGPEELPEGGPGPGGENRQVSIGGPEIGPEELPEGGPGLEIGKYAAWHEIIDRGPKKSE